MPRKSMSRKYNILNINRSVMDKAKKGNEKKVSGKKITGKKSKKITLLDAAIMGAMTPTMGGTGVDTPEIK
jgi:hypothetical protein